MTNYNKWDKKANDLVDADEEEDKAAKAENDKACGLEDGPQGPPTAAARERRSEMGSHSGERKNFIADQQGREVSVTHTGKPNAIETVVLSAEEANGKALRLSGSIYVSYEIPEGVELLKLFVDKCKNITVTLKNSITTSTVEVYQCSDLLFRSEKSVATVQCDECAAAPVRFTFAEPEMIGAFYHQNSPSLEVHVDGDEVARFGRAEERQFVTRPSSEQGKFVTEALLRGERDFPVNAGGMSTPSETAVATEPDAEALTVSEEMRQKAEKKRLEGNEAFRANDFLQAAAHYTESLGMCPDLHLACANRAQCFLHTGQPEKALEDAARCTELAPDYAKGWFRKGMALHALRKYGTAIPALTKAEDLDPKNTQIPEAIKMAQLMCRKHGPEGDRNL